jgi:adenylate kinase family enzyme
MSGMSRIVVVGSSGSGKTTTAATIAGKLGLPHLEMDTVFHRDGLADEAHEDFLPILDEFTSADRWIVDGNYTSQGTTDVVWPKADTFVWLDPPRRVAMYRVIRRTLKRTLLREELWNGVREPMSNLYSLDPYRNIIVWTWTRHPHVRDKYQTAMADGRWEHAEVHRLRSAAEVEGFIGSLGN